MTPPIKPEQEATPVAPAPPVRESYESASSKMLAAFGKAKGTRPAVLDTLTPESAESTGAVLPSQRPNQSAADTAKKVAGAAASVAKGAGRIVTHPLATAKSVGRGVVSMVDDTVETLISLTASVVGADGQKVAEDATQFIDNTRDWIFGPRSDAPSQQFVEDTSQFLSGFIGVGKFKAFSQFSKASPIAGAALKGAVVDFAAFDPYKEQLAELAAGSNIPGIEGLGQMLSVEGDDGPLVARFKRAAGGLIPGLAIDGLVAGARFVRASAALKDPALAPAARKIHEAALQENGKILSDIEAGTHVPDEPVVVKQTPDGKYAVGRNEMPTRTPEDAARAQAEREVPYGEITARDERRRVQMAFEGGERRAIHADEPVFENRWEAEARTASINETLAISRAAAAKVTAEDMGKIHSLAAAITEANGDAEQIVGLMHEMRFNFTYKDSPEKVTSLLKAIGEVLSPVFDKTQGRPGVPFSESLERARQLAGMIPRDQVLDFFRNSGHVIKNSDAILLSMDAFMDDLGAQVAKWGEILDTRSLDPVAVKQAKESLQVYANFVADVAGSNSGQGRGLAALKARGELKDLKFKGESGAAKPAAKKGLGPDIIEGMTAVEVRDLTQLFRQSRQPRVLFDAMEAVVAPRDPKTAVQVVRGAVEYFYNSIMSQPATWKAIWLANATVSGIEDAVRGMAGVATGNKELVQEAADLIQGRLIFSRQSVKGMAMALKAGHSIIDPKPIYKEIPTIAGEVVRTMGTRPIAAMDEFWRVNNNLSYVRMKALRLARRDGRAKGLKGKAFDRYIADRAEAAVRASIDPRTGASRLPEARAFAAFPTFSMPLKPDTFAADLEEMVQKHKLLVPILPFVRTSANVIDYSFVKGSPLGVLTDDFKRVMKAGGEEAAIHLTRMTVGSTIWGMAGLMAFNDKITGAGPNNPELRQAWLVNHQPYSFKMGGKWISYRRLEPFATPLSLMADMAQMSKDNADDAGTLEDISQIAYGLIAATASATTNKTYMSGLIRFGDAIGSSSASGMKSFLDGITNPLVPGLLAGLNDDPYMRQTTEMFGALRNRVRGWSNDLPAKYNGFGEPMRANPSRTDRAFNVFPDRKVTESVEDEFLMLGKAFAPPPSQERFGNMSVNLLSRKYLNANKNIKATPYERWMELIRAQGLRGQIEEIVKSEAYQNAGDGNDSFVGGRRFVQLRNRYERVYDATKRAMLGEYPELDAELRALGRAARTTQRSDAGGQSILDQIKR